jgi:WD40-like Beta Propeller Repeat
VTPDQIELMVRRANPVPDPNVLSTVTTLTALEEKVTATMQTQEETRDREPVRSGGRSRYTVIATTVLAVAASFAIFMLTRGDDTPGPAGVASTVPSVVSTTVPLTTTAPTGSTQSPLGLELVGLDGTSTNLGLPADAWNADLTADGRTVAFVTESITVGFCGACGSPFRVAIVNVGSSEGVFAYFHDGDGGVLDEGGQIGQLAWSPDGTRLAFQATSMTPERNLDIYVADLSSTAVVTDPGSDLSSTALIDVPTIRLTTDPAVDEFPAWSPDGSVIYYDNLGSAPADSGIADSGEIWSVPVTGGEPTRLTNDDIGDMQPDVRLDGTIAYWHGGDIWTMGPDGGSKSRLNDVPGGLGWNPRWSPDGTKLALLHYSGRQAAYESNAIHPTTLAAMDVVIVELDTGEVSTLDARVASFYNPVSWLSDGENLLVVRY